MNRSTITYEQLAKAIDHSLLKPELTQAEVIAGCELAKRYNVASVCVHPCDVALAAKMLQGSSVAVGTVIGFPHGATTTAVKVFEAEEAIRSGATELDMVLNIGMLRSGELEYVREDIASVVRAAAGKALVKVILENAYLTDEQKVAGCRAAEAAGANFVKTSTGFAPGGATLPDLRLMRETVSPHVRIKAAGGVRSLAAALDVLEAGCSRFGATATSAILEEFKAQAAGPQVAAPQAEKTVDRSGEY